MVRTGSTNCWIGADEAY